MTIFLKDIQQLYFLSCIIKSLDYTKFHFNFLVNGNLHFKVKIKGLPKKELKNVIDSLFITQCKQIDYDCYNNQYEIATEKERAIFFKLKRLCSHIEFSNSGNALSIVQKLSTRSDIERVPDIEKGIALLILAINKIPEFCTVYSCQGHRFSILPMSPFVSFVSTSDDKVLRFVKLLNKNADKFFYKWFIDGTVINCCPLYVPYILWRLSIKDFFFLRERLFRDFDSIDKILSSLS